MDQARQDGATPLVIACNNGHEACAKLLLLSGASADATDVRGDIPRAIARRKGLGDVLALM